MPKISVIMPVYNSEKYLREAMDSILNQTFTDFEFIILDDGSTDSSPAIVAGYDDPRIRFYQNEKNMGVAATLNRGLELATGEYIARMDGDDVSLPRRFELQVAYMDTHPNVAVCGTAIELIGAQRGVRTFAQTPEQMRVDMLFACCLAHPSVMMRGSVFGKGGLRYDKAFSKMEDYALWVETAREHDLSSVPGVLLQYRIHPGQVTQKPSEEREKQLRALRTKQMERIGLPVCGEKFEAFLCMGDSALDEEKRALLIGYLCDIRDENRRRKHYDPKVLESSINAAINRELNRFPLAKALELAKQCGWSGTGYGVKRVLRGKRAALSNALAAKRRRANLKHKDFTILSNNCWGGFVQQKYGLPYNSPTVGLYIPGDDFVRFCADWRGYMAKELNFIPWEKARLYPQIKDSAPYPVAMLGDVEIYFMHYRSQEEAREKWERRKARINPDRIIFKLSQRECCGREDIERFMALPEAHKVCFAYDEVPGVVLIPELRGLAGDEQPLTEAHFDELEFLNRL